MSADFDPNAASSSDSGVFGLPHGVDDAAVVLVPVPWEVTTSYGGGTSEGPRAILAASRQVDLFDLDVERPYEAGIVMLDEPAEVRRWNAEGKALAQPIIDAGGAGTEHAGALAKVDALGRDLDAWVRATALEHMRREKIVGVVGGDHSVPFGAIAAAADHHGPLGVLHFDAHSDTRRAYEGFARSHASIMFNVLEEIPRVSRLVQVGIRDVCEEEIAYTRAAGDRVRTFFDRDLARRKQDGEPFGAVAREIAAALPERVWVSFDIDGLDPRLCPHTGTPVPGGLDFWEAVRVLREVCAAGKRIVGFDLNEVAPNLADPGDEWDGNVGARLLYKLVGFTLASQGRARLLP